ncbi:retroviral-like aspartic protease family protein [Swingsia samuiensis]|uniref:Peptidase A2 domain-containing protein n=1 Tax=Swingsia samuiensis TaxID=1293412 RepID=A0A4Y6UL51_9PROT|nr:retroviral-like aspartic protease family protein [Swingsia samuiensis]QDH17097.1 hypothetical protein E3D00_05605 [Swingsia samuiensis]
MTFAKIYNGFFVCACLLLTYTLLLGTHALAAPCTLKRAITLSIKDTGGYLSIPVKINGSEVSMIIDTGSQGSLMTPEGVHLLHLPTDPNHHTIMQGPNGTPRLVPNISIHNLSFGHLNLGPGSMPTGNLPGAPILHPPILGLLGADAIDGYDLEFNIPHHQLTFWKATPSSPACTIRPLWKGKWNTILARETDGRLMVPFILDGTRGIALLDSGARSHIINTAFTYRLGLNDELLALDPGGVSAGVDLHQRRYHWHRFHRFTMGGTVWLNPVLTVAPVHDQADMLLGSDWFSKHDIWLSYSSGQVFVQ